MTVTDLSELFRKKFKLTISYRDLMLLLMAIPDCILYLKEHGNELDKKRGGNSKELIKDYKKLLSSLEKFNREIKHRRKLEHKRRPDPLGTSR